MHHGHVLVVGAGQAGLQTAASLRDEGFAGRITLLGDEPGLPYQRPPLSKAYMKDGNAARLALKAADFFRQQEIILRSEVRVTEIDRAAQQVTTASGERIGYDHLVLATGARNLKPPITGTDHGRVVELRTLGDAEHIRDLLSRTRHAIVIGGGFIGLEFASVARAAGLEVTVVEAVQRLMARAVSPPISARFLAEHQDAGVQILFGALATAIERGTTGDSVGVSLSDGRHLAGDLVLIATGVVPNAELAANAGLAVENGVVVDDMLLTADLCISAIGDCAAVPGPFGARVRLESVQAAIDHARHLARRLVTGDRRPYSEIPWFWSDQGPLKLQIAGLPAGAERTVARPATGPAELVASFRSDRLVAVETVNAPGQHMAARRLLAHPGGVHHDDLARADFDVRGFWKALSSQ